MTVAIGLVCADGVIAAADSMSSAGTRAATGRKVYALEQIPLIWTAAGSVYAIEECDVALRELEDFAESQPLVRDQFLKPDLGGIRRNVSTYVRGALKKCYESAMLYGPQAPPPQPHPFAADLLILGWSNNSPYLLEVAGDAQLNWHTEAKFYASGTGGDFAAVAQALMAHYLEGPSVPTERGLQLAYRTIETVCQVSSSFVALPVQLAVADAQGARVLSADEVEDVKEAVQAWRTVERETFLSPGRPDDVSATAVEEPPTFDEPS